MLGLTGWRYAVAAIVDMLIHAAVAWVIAFIACAYFSRVLFEFLVLPLREILKDQPLI